MYVKLESGDIQKLHGKRLLLFGAGSLGVRSIEECRKIDAEILGFIDNNPSRRGEKLEGYPIYGPQDIRQFPDAYVLITSTYVDEIKEQLAVMGIKKVEVIRLGALRDTIDQEAFYRPLMTKQESNWYLYEHLCGEQPFFAGRLGSNELECMTEYYYVLDRAGCGHGKDGTGAEVRDHDEKEALDKGSRNLGAKEAYHDNLKLVMKQGAGFFPVEDAYLDRFVRLYSDNLQEIDFIWSMWLSRFENLLYQRFAPDKEIGLYDDTALPYDLDMPWTKALEGKKVLVIHPFEESILENYAKRERLFDHPGMLPKFELITLKSVQSIADENVPFEDWFAALSYMEDQISRMEFDIALIGAGAYGFPLGAYVKQLGKKAVHIGGMLQLLFGIKGKAWNKLGIYNEYWTSPKESEKPKGYQSVEAGRYW